MDRRSFLTTTTAAAATLAFPAILRAQSKDPLRIGVPAAADRPLRAPSPPTCSGAPSSPRTS